MRVPRLLFLLVASLLAQFVGSVPVNADGPGDNAPGAVRPIPKPGIDVPADVRSRLEAGAAKLKSAMDELAERKDARTSALLPDVWIFHKAVDGALRHQEFFDRREFDAAEQLLRAGQERAEQLKRGEAPWTEARGLVVRGYVSKIDGSVQPYGLVVPESYTHRTAGRYRTDVWLHGRNETLSELNFLVDRLKNPGQFTPPDTIVLHPYGRYCNAFKFAGEVDVFEALDSVRQRYRVDDDRTTIRGFSMGGAGAWHLAVHHPGRWCAANPGAGFAETPAFLRMSQQEELQMAPWERKLLHYYDCTDWALNLFNCPTVAYSGELDPQKQAADIMAKAMLKHHLHLRHVIGPQTKHSYHPDAAKIVEQSVADNVKIGRLLAFPMQARFRTYTLRYNRVEWLTVDALDEHWSPATVESTWALGEAEPEARVADEDERESVQTYLDFEVATENVTALTLALPAGTAPLETVQFPARVFIDGAEVVGPKPESDRSWTCQLHREGDAWKLGPPPGDHLRKRHGLQGPIDDAFLDSFLFVRPTGKARHDAVEKWVQNEMQRALVEWRRQFRGEPRVKGDTAVTAGDMAASHVVLWGDPAGNKLLAQMLDKLPVRWTTDELALGDGEHSGKHAAAHHVPILIYPNPLSPKKYVVLNSGFTFREYDYLTNARQIPRLPDWAIVDIRTPPDARRPGKIVAADFFDEFWRVKQSSDER